MRAMRVVAMSIMAVAAGAANAAPGEYWEVKTRMNMEGMSMPPMQSRVCMPTDAPDEDMVPAGDDDCRPTNFQTRGNKTTYSFECTGKEAMSGEGEFERLGPDAYRSRTVMRTEDGEMVMEFEGRKVGGACDTEAPMRQVQAQMAAGQAEMCRARGESLLPPGRDPNLPPELDPGCEGQLKSAYCEGAKEKYGEMSDRGGFDRVASGGAGWRAALEFCGLDVAGLEKRVCDAAAADQDYYFVARACEAEARRIAATCAGRDGTSLAAAGQSNLLPICAKYGPGGPIVIEMVGPAASEPAAAPPEKPSAFDKLKKGTKGLKDMIKIPGT